MTPISISADPDDAVLVERSRSGDRQAFGRIVARYQSLVCALAYSATGSRAQSEDLAQETFVAAWRNLRGIREPDRLRSWLCGIARNVIRGELRRRERQPAPVADALDAAATIPCSEPLPTAQAVSNEEMTILWREVSRLPEMYREPLILFYREHKSAEHVAEALELTPDAVMQRLSRGRRLLQERMLVFVETTLERTNPGPDFTLQVTAALPLLAAAGPATALGSVAKGGAAAKGGLGAILLAWAAPLVGVFAAIGVSWVDLSRAPTKRERAYTARWLLAVWVSAAALIFAMPVVGHYAHATGLARRDDWLATLPFVLMWFGFAMVAVTLIVFMLRGKVALRRQVLAETGPDVVPPKPVSLATRITMTIAAVMSLYWVLIFVAWETGDRAIAAAIFAGVIIITVVPVWYAHRRGVVDDGTKIGGWYLSLFGLVFLALLNWRLDVWVAAAYGVDLATMHRLLSMPLVHGLSAVIVGWTALLAFVTAPSRAT